MNGRFRSGPSFALTNVAAWALALLWISPLLYAFWSAFHPAAYSARFDLLAPLTIDNFVRVWSAAPFARYFVNTFMLVSLILVFQLVICTLAAYAFASFPFKGSNLLFMLVLVQLMIMPEVLLVENYRTLSKLGLLDTTFGIGLPYLASAFGIFLMRQTFKSIPKELEAIVPHLAVPVQPLLEGASRPYAMFKDYWKYDWVLPVYRYEGIEPLLATLAEKVIAPAERKVKALEERRSMIEAELTKPQ